MNHLGTIGGSGPQLGTIGDARRGNGSINFPRNAGLGPVENSRGNFYPSHTTSRGSWNYPRNSGLGPVVSNIGNISSNRGTSAHRGVWNNYPGYNPFSNSQFPGNNFTPYNSYNPLNWWNSLNNFPNNYPPMSWNGHHYYYHDGNFFHLLNGIYQVVLPVLGLVLQSLPSGAVPIDDYNNYYYYHGICYQQVANGYQVTSPPIGACLPELPYFAQQNSYNGVPYYSYDNVYIRIVTLPYGGTCYRVVSTPYY